jgi:hypothetical protein
MSDYPKPPYPSQRQPMPGSTEKMDPRPGNPETTARIVANATAEMKPARMLPPTARARWMGASAVPFGLL